MRRAHETAAMGAHSARYSETENALTAPSNARVETVASKPAFRAAFQQRRCLIPADGYFEWQAAPGSKTKQPYFIILRNREPMALAGLWELWHDEIR